MEFFYKILLKAHVIAGFTSLLLFWIPALSKKGSKLHNKTGIVYCIFMAFVVLSAFILSILALYLRNNGISLALLFLSLITYYPFHYGYLMATKKVLSARQKSMFLGLGTAIFMLGIYMLFLALVSKEGLFFIFGPLGTVSGLLIIRERLRQKSYNYIAEHLSGMISSGGAAYTAFFAFGARSFMPDVFTTTWLGILPWILPTMIASIAAAQLSKRYSKLTHHPEKTQS